MTDPADAQLVRSTLDGDQEAYKQLISRYQGHVYGLAYSLVDNWAEAQDIAQEAFIRAYTNLDQLRKPEKFAAWLRRVAFSVAMDWLRTFRPGSFQQLSGEADLEHLEIPDFRPGPPEHLEKRELADAVLAAVASLPPKYRLPLTMFHLDGLSYKKVAAFLDIPLGTVQGLIHRARQKLKAALPAAIAKEMTPVVQEVFNKHKLPEEFAAKVIENVPVLAWGKGKECTYVGALEAAMAVTEHPYKYTDLMGFSGLAFRVRWSRWQGQPRWCHSCAVGEFPEETEAIEKATGWRLRHEVHFGETNLERLAPQIVAAIDAGKPVIGYDDRMDMAVAYGYQDDGKTILWRDYWKGEKDHPLPSGKIGPLLSFLDQHVEPTPRRDALAEALRTAVRNWRRDHGDGGVAGRDYWYGDAALAAWIRDLGSAEELDEQTRQALYDLSRWNFITLVDARAAAASFLTDNADLLAGAGRKALQRATAAFRKELDLLLPPLRKKQAFDSPAGKCIDHWSVEIRQRECGLLTKAREIEAAAVAEMEKALAAEGIDVA